jgi:hypothetical protein
MRIYLLPFYYALLTVALAGPALAVDGVLEINQACAAQTGCFAGDTAGFPVDIIEAGSYLLTGNLIAPTASTSMIRINADNVTLNLNGFSIIGPTECTGTPTVCDTPDPNNGTGIGGGASSVTIKNGTVRGMGSRGIDFQLGEDIRVVDVRVISNGEKGILASARSIVLNCTISINGDVGLWLNGSGTAYGSNTINGNAGGTVAATEHNQLGSNVCNGSLTCP